jgi:hypothetical protein
MEKNNLIFYLNLLVGGGGGYPKCEIVGGGVFFNLNLLVVPLYIMGGLPPGDTFFWNSPYEF